MFISSNGPVYDLPVSSNQERSLLMKELLRAQSLVPSPSILASAFRIAGELKYNSLRETLDEIVRRHASLRARFFTNPAIPPRERASRLLKFAKSRTFDSGLYRQSIADHASVPLSCIDLKSVNEVALDSEVAKIVINEYKRGFEYSQPPLLRACLIQTHVDVHLLLVFVDHLASDARSMFVLGSEIELLYTHFTQQTPYPLAPLTSSYPAFAAWQNEMAGTTYFQAAIDYWQKYWEAFGTSQLSSDDLPFATRATITDPLFVSEKLCLRSKTCASIDKVLVETGVSLHMLCFSALILLLGIYSGKSRVAIGCHFANRSQSESQGDIGFYSNTHIVGLDLTDAADGHSLLRQSREAIINCFLHSDVPFPLVWKTMADRYDYPDFSIVLDTNVNRRFRRNPSQLPTTANISGIKQVALPDIGAPRLARLGFYVTQSVDGIVVDVYFRRAKFRHASIRRMLKTFNLLIQGIAFSPNKALSELTDDFKYF